MPAAHRLWAGRAFPKSSLFKQVWRHGGFAWRYEDVRDAGRSRGFMCLCEWRRRHPAHGDLPGSLAGPVSKPAGTVRSSFLPVVPADGLAGTCRGQPGRRGQAPYSLHPRITGPGLERCEDGGIMRPVRGGGDKFSFPPHGMGRGTSEAGEGPPRHTGGVPVPCLTGLPALARRPFDPSFAKATEGPLPHGMGKKEVCGRG